MSDKSNDPAIIAIRQGTLDYTGLPPATLESIIKNDVVTMVLPVVMEDPEVFQSYGEDLAAAVHALAKTYPDQDLSVGVNITVNSVPCRMTVVNVPESTINREDPIIALITIKPVADIRVTEEEE